MSASAAAAIPAPAAGAARIGPNAITRTAQALREAGGEAAARTVFAYAGLTAYLDAPPQHMVDERAVTALHVALRACCPAQADALAARAGQLTAEYLLAHRIPRPAQWLLRLLPPAPAARLLLRAIGGHAWTFAGSGVFTADVAPARARGATLRIAGCPLCRGLGVQTPAASAKGAAPGPAGRAALAVGTAPAPAARVPTTGSVHRAAPAPTDCAAPAVPGPVCGFYAATFGHLFRTLVAPGAQVVESACAALGAPACTFDVRW